MLFFYELLKVQFRRTTSTGCRLTKNAPFELIFFAKCQIFHPLQVFQNSEQAPKVDIFVKFSLPLKILSVRKTNFLIFQKWSQMTSKGSRNLNLPNRRPGKWFQYEIKSKIYKKSKKKCKKSNYEYFEGKIKHFRSIFREKDQTLYLFQGYDLVEK